MRLFRRQRLTRSPVEIGGHPIHGRAEAPTDITSQEKFSWDGLGQRKGCQVTRPGAWKSGKNPGSRHENVSGRCGGLGARVKCFSPWQSPAPSDDLSERWRQLHRPAAQPPCAFLFNRR